MNPEQTGERYHRVASQWRANLTGSSYGLAMLRRAAGFCRARHRAIDIGCGSEGRFLREMVEQGFESIEGLDIAPGMIELAAAAHPDERITFHVADVSHWRPRHRYDLITAWDSTFHLPPDLHEPVLRQLCAALSPGGVLLFTCGGGPGPGEAAGTFLGEDFEYSTPGMRKYLRLLDDCDCHPRHLEYDQFPENHVSVIAERIT